MNRIEREVLNGGVMFITTMRKRDETHTHTPHKVIGMLIYDIKGMKCMKRKARKNHHQEPSVFFNINGKAK